MDMQNTQTRVSTMAPMVAPASTAAAQPTKVEVKDVRF